MASSDYGEDSYTGATRTGGALLPPAPLNPGQQVGTILPRPAAGTFNPALGQTSNDVDAYRSAFAEKWFAGGGKGNPAQFQAALIADPRYMELQKIHRDTQQAGMLGVSQPDYSRAQSAAQYLQNSAQAIPTYAQAEATRAGGVAARDTGQGQQALAAAEHLRAMLAFDQQASQANTGLTTAQAGKTNVEANELPRMNDAHLAQAGVAEDLKRRQAEAEIGLKNAQANHEGYAVNPNTGKLMPVPGAAPPATQPAQPFQPATGAATNPGMNSPYYPPQPSPVTPLPATQEAQVPGSPGALYAESLWANRQLTPPAGAPGNFSNYADQATAGQGINPLARQQKKLPDGRIVETEGNSTFLVLPNGQRFVMTVK